MKMKIYESEKLRVAVVEEGRLASVADALDMLADANHLHGCQTLAIPQSLVDERFFDLRSGLAGEVLQKFTNYGVKAAFLGDFSAYDSKALRDFIRESNRVGNIVFLPTLEEAVAAMSR